MESYLPLKKRYRYDIDLTADDDNAAQETQRKRMPDQPQAKSPCSWHTIREEIILSDDDDNRSVSPARQSHGATQTSLPATQGENENPSTDGHDEEDEELDLVIEIPGAEAEVLDQRFAQRSAIPSGYRRIPSAKTRYDLVVKAGSDLQIIDGDFFRVKAVLEDVARAVYLMGLRLRRKSAIGQRDPADKRPPLHSLMSTPLNEVCVVMKTPAGQVGNTTDEQCWCIIPLDAVQYERRIIFTNHVLPNFSFREDGMPCTNEKERLDVRETGVLCCRRKYVEEIDVTGKKVVGWQLAPLQQEECDPGKGRSDIDLRRGYGKRPDTTHKAKNAMPHTKQVPTLGPQIIDLTINDRSQRTFTRKRTFNEVVEEETISPARKSAFRRETTSTTEDSFTPVPQPISSHQSTRSQTDPFGGTRFNTSNKNRYTLGDVCSGGGFVSRAGVMERLSLKWFLDNWEPAIETGKRNFPSARPILMAVEDFVTEIRFTANGKVDILHISYPCPGHSRQNRGTNPERDLRNNALVLSIQQLIEKCQPRRVSLEQTDHILTKNNGFYFRKVIAQIEQAGYSIRWKVCNMLEYGVPSYRKRLMILASCPGDRLSDWPAPTHGPGLNEPVTFDEAIRGIPHGATLHDVAERKRRMPRKLPFADPGKPLRQIIKTSGFLANHPDGYWPTYRQQLRLMTVPDEHDLKANVKRTSQPR